MRLRLRVCLRLDNRYERSLPSRSKSSPHDFLIASSFFFFQAEDGIRDRDVTGGQTCALPISHEPIWFDILRRMAPAWEVRRIVGWSYELGVQIELPAGDERARIEKYLDEGEEVIGGNLAR